MQKVSDFKDLSAAEAALIAAVKAGRPCVVQGDGKTLPDANNPAHRIRAELLAVLITGGSPECGLSPFGVEVYGAQIIGELRLTHLSAVGDTHICYCRFDKTPNLRYAKFKNLILNGSDLPGLNGRYAHIEAGMSLCKVHSIGSVEISGCRIGGQLGCDEAKFLGGIYDKFFRFVIKDAFSAQGIVIGADALFRGVECKDRINLLAAKIEGQLVFRNINFTGGDGDELFAQGINVRGLFALDGKERILARVSLASAYAKDLRDELDIWPYNLDINGFTYDRFIDLETAYADKRLPWLKKGSYRNGAFSPQPYTQAAKVLRAMGHDGEARKILVAREQILAREVRRRWNVRDNDRAYLVMENPYRTAGLGLLWLWDLAQRTVVGYGFAPYLALRALAVLLAFAFILAHFTWENGDFAPNSDVILTSVGWQATLVYDCENFVPNAITVCDHNPANTWAGQLTRGMDWDTFNAPAYALDLVVPILTLGQTDAWAPSKDRGAWGWALWWGRWVLIMGGWLVSALGVAAITGVMQRERE